LQCSLVFTPIIAEQYAENLHLSVRSEMILLLSLLSFDYVMVLCHKSRYLISYKQIIQR
jgi:hypothetical protein